LREGRQIAFLCGSLRLICRVPQQGLRMIDFRRIGIGLAEGGAKAAAALVLLAGLASLAGGLAGCSAGTILGAQPQPAAAPAPEPAGEPEAAPPETAAPPVDLAGKWQLAAAAGGACVMNFSDAPNAAAGAGAIPQGAIAPEAGCPGNFFTSRKWAFEEDKLVIRDFKGRPLAQLSYLGAHFEGRDKNGGALTLSKQQ
jgi:hypothetical protein